MAYLSFQEAVEYINSYSEVSNSQSWKVVKQLLEDVSYGIGSFTEDYINKLISEDL